MTEQDERPAAVRVMEQGAGWTGLRFNEDAGVWVGVPPFPEGDLWGSTHFVPNIRVEEAGSGWTAYFFTTPTFGAVAATPEGAIEALIAKMVAFRTTAPVFVTQA